MADKEQNKQNLGKMLDCFERALSFVSSINPLFGIVKSLVHEVRKVLVDEEYKQTDKKFQELRDELNSISNENKKLLDDIHFREVNVKLNPFYQKIMHQYSACNDMLNWVRKDPGNADHYMKEFEEIYEQDHSTENLHVFYKSIMTNEYLFGSDLLKVYLDHCGKNNTVMKARCSQLKHLFHIGLTALMAYYSITKDDVDKHMGMWTQRLDEIQHKMGEILKQCNDN